MYVMHRFPFWSHICRIDQALRLHEVTSWYNTLDGTIDVPMHSRLIASRFLTSFPIDRNDGINYIAAQKALPSMRVVT